MKHSNDSTDFYTVADDNEYYMGTSIDFLDSVKAKIIPKEAKGSLAFKAKSGEVFNVKLDTLYWKILLFNGKGKPILADIMMIQDDYKKYMK